MAASEAADKTGIRHVAVLAGVSHMTVSRVLNGHQNVRESTRQRVLDVIQDLNFKPNSVARALATHKSRRIGVIIESAVEFGPMSTLRAIEGAARDAGYTISAIALHDSTLTPPAAVDDLIAQGVDAICVIAPRSSSLATLRKISIDVPMLAIKSSPDRVFLTVGVDQNRGTVLALDHLAALGHRDVLHLSGPFDWLDARARAHTYRVRSEALGMAQRPIVRGDWTADFGFDFASSLTQMPDYTAIFVANDEMALGVIHGLHERGISVPGDISVIGFDDLPTSRHFLPPLTTVRQDFHTLGLRALDGIRAAIENAPSAGHAMIPTDLVVRASTAPPRAV